MFHLFQALKQIAQSSIEVTDNAIFRLHYKCTVFCFIAFSVLVTSKQYFGDAIDCIQRDDIPPSIMNTYCWIDGTYSMSTAFAKPISINSVPYPGIGKSTEATTEDRIYHRYYQWVSLVLLLQAASFYIPRFLWKIGGADKMAHLVLSKLPLLDSADKTQHLIVVHDYLKTHRHQHGRYLITYIICEGLNLVNVVIQMCVVDRFLGGQFSTFGLRVMQYKEKEGSVDPRIRLFPLMAKCTFLRFGPSGNVQKHDAYCLLALNVINEKIYLFLWFWFIALCILSSAVLVYRVATLVSPMVRVIVLRYRTQHHPALASLCRHLPLGDWFILYTISKNVDARTMRTLLSLLTDHGPGLIEEETDM